MNKKLYKRDGRRFVPVEDLTGEIREVEGTKAICVLQTTTERCWATIDAPNKRMTHCQAIEYVKTQFNGKGVLPSRSLLLILQNKYKEKVNAHNWYYWTADVYERASDSAAWALGWSGGYVYYGNKGDTLYVRAFLIEKI